MKYRLEAPFRSISGVIERKQMLDGSIMTLIAKQNGTLYWQRRYPRCSKKEERI